MSALTDAIDAATAAEARQNTAAAAIIAAYAAIPARIADAIAADELQPSANVTALTSAITQEASNLEAALNAPPPAPAARKH